MNLPNNVVSNPLYRHMDIKKLLDSSTPSYAVGELDAQSVFSSGVVITPSGISFDGRIQNYMYRDVHVLRHDTDKYRYLFENNNTVTDIKEDKRISGMIIKNKSTAKDYTVLYVNNEEKDIDDIVPVYVEIAPYSNANLHEVFTNVKGTHALRIVYVLREGAKLNLTRNFNTHKNNIATLQVIESRIIQHPSSQLNLECVYTDTFDYIQDLYFVNAHKYTVTNIKNRYTVKNENSAHVISDVSHIGPASVSNVDIKSVTLDHSKFTFAGNIKVDKQAENIDANLQNKNLQMSDSATTITEPKLDISTKEIACSHGCTVSSIQPEQLYFLNSKGFDNETAKQILMEAFING